MDSGKLRTESRRVVVCAMLAAVMAALQVAMSFLPNIEPVSLLILVYTLVFGEERSSMVWAAASGAFGLSFGALDALPYLAGGPMAALSRWVAGIPFDLLHCAGNFVLALALERPLYQVLVRLRDRGL